MIGRKFFVSFLRFAVDDYPIWRIRRGNIEISPLKEGWKDARDVGGRLEISWLEVSRVFRLVFSLAPKISNARPIALTRQNMIAWRSSVDELSVARILI